MRKLKLKTIRVPVEVDVVLWDEFKNAVYRVAERRGQRKKGALRVALEEALRLWIKMNDY